MRRNVKKVQKPNPQLQPTKNVKSPDINKHKSVEKNPEKCPKEVIIF